MRSSQALTAPARLIVRPAESAALAIRHIRRSCADDRMCQGWRSHHVVASKTPFTQPTGSQTLRNEVALDQASSGAAGIVVVGFSVSLLRCGASAA